MEILIQDWAGWLLLGLSFVFPLCFPRFLSNPRLLIVFWVCLFLHHYVAIHNAYISQTIGADADAWLFQKKAVAASAYEPQYVKEFGNRFYLGVLTTAYRLFGPSHLFGQELSIWAFLISCFFFLGIVSQLGLQRYEVLLLALFGGLPSMILFGSVTLRESYQILFFVGFVYFGLQFHLRGRWVSMGLSALGAFLLGLTHQGLMPYAVFAFFVMLIWRIRTSSKLVWPNVSLRRVTALAVLLGFLAVSVSGLRGFVEDQGLKTASAILEGEGMDFVSTYREGGMRGAARTTYSVTVDTSSLIGFAKSILPAVGLYMFAPFLWQARNALDLYAAFESFMRLVLVIFAISYFLKSRGPLRSMISLLLVLYFSMSVLWALGTVNYGTALRHHIVNYWILVLLGVPPLMAFLRGTSDGIVPSKVPSTL